MGKRFAEIAERMAADVETGDILFKSEPLTCVKVGNVRQGRRKLVKRIVLKQGHLSADDAVTVLGGAVKGTLIDGMQLGTVGTCTVKCTGKNQGFNGTFVDQIRTDAGAEGIDIRVGTAETALCYDGVNCPFTAGFYGAKSKADTWPSAGIIY